MGKSQWTSLLRNWTDPMKSGRLKHKKEHLKHRYCRLHVLSIIDSQHITTQTYTNTA